MLPWLNPDPGAGGHVSDDSTVFAVMLSADALWSDVASALSGVVSVDPSIMAVDAVSKRLKDEVFNALTGDFVLLRGALRPAGEGVSGDGEEGEDDEGPVGDSMDSDASLGLFGDTEVEFEEELPFVEPLVGLHEEEEVEEEEEEEADILESLGERRGSGLVSRTSTNATPFKLASDETTPAVNSP